MGPLLVTQGATQYDIAYAKQSHKDNLCTFKEYQLMQRALVGQRIQAVDKQYIAALRRLSVGHITSNCRGILLYLFRVHSKVIPQQLVSEVGDR